MSSRIPPLSWPAFAILSPFWVPVVLRRYRTFRRGRTRAAEVNRSRIAAANAVEIPEVDEVELRVLSEWRARDGFSGEAGVSYLFRTSLGSLLYDVGFGDESGIVAQNAQHLGVTAADLDAVAISHLHNDHMGGLKAFRTKQVDVPAALRPERPVPGYLPAEVGMEGFNAEVVTEPRLLAGGILSTGPLARQLFFLGWTEEQALVMRLRGKGLVICTGCGHPTLSVILEMVRRLSREPIHAIVGGLHLPVTGGRIRGPGGIDLQTLLGTGKPPWRRITEGDLDDVIDTIRAEGPKRLLLSAHDTCDYALGCLERGTGAEVEILEAGGTYRL